MIDPVQSALFLVIIILTFLLLILGIQVFFILRQLSRTIDKANRLLDDEESITGSVSKAISSFSTLRMGLQTGATIAKILQGGHKHHDKKDE